MGYSTRYGDSVREFSPIKPPIGGLTNKTDEDNLGFTYAVLDRYMRTGICEDEHTKALIDREHEANLFKLQLMPSYKPDIK